MGITRITLKKDEKLTRAEKAELKKAFKKPITFDDDAPQLTPEQMQEIAAIARAQRKERKKEVIALRLPPDTIEKAKATGKGYTGFLARLIENAINDPDLVKRSL